MGLYNDLMDWGKNSNSGGSNNADHTECMCSAAARAHIVWMSIEVGFFHQSHKIILANYSTVLLCKLMPVVLFLVSLLQLRLCMLLVPGMHKR